MFRGCRLPDYSCEEETSDEDTGDEETSGLEASQ